MKRSVPQPQPQPQTPKPWADRNRSLERGIALLRAFRPGADLLGNGDLAERTGLSPATVSRLTGTLVDCGLLEHDRAHRAYRLAAPVLSLAHAMRSGSRALAAAGPLMRAEAERRRINVGLAVADGDEMVYLESARYAPRVTWRNVVAGQRVPMASTSLGRAWLAAAPDDERRRAMRLLRARSPSHWRTLSREIATAIADVRTLGFCWASWQPRVVALATPVLVADHPVYVVNMSVASDAPAAEIVAALGAPLLRLATRIGAALEAR